MVSLAVPKTKHQYHITDEQYEKIEQMFREKRIKAGYKVQEDAAEALNISQDLISRVEHSFTPNMQIGHIGWIMKHYKIVPNDLFSLMGMFEPPVQEVGEREYIRREILPMLGRLSPQSLRTLKRIAESFLAEERRTYTTVSVSSLRSDDMILWDGVERRVTHVIAEDKGTVQVYLVPRTHGEDEVLTLDAKAKVDLLQK